MCNEKEQQLYLDIDYEKLQNFNFVQSDEEANGEFSMINPNFPDLDLVDSDSVSNATVVSTITVNLLLPNEQFYEIFSQLNEGQQHIFSVIMHYTLHCKLAKKNNELPAKPFQIFLNGVAGTGFFNHCNN